MVTKEMDKHRQQKRWKLQAAKHAIDNEHMTINQANNIIVSDLKGDYRGLVKAVKNVK